MDNKKEAGKIYQRIAHIALIVNDYDEAIEFYTKKIDWMVFIASGIVAIVIALSTVSIKAIKAAIANPVKSLRTE